MTISTAETRNEYTANAGQTVFNFNFKIYTDQDLDVYVTPAGQDANDSTDLTTNYVIDPGSIGTEAGGFLTLTTPTALNDLVTIVSSIVENRTVDYQNNGDFRPVVVNGDFDRSISLIKQISDEIARRPQFESSQQGVIDITLPAPDAGKGLVWNSGETGFDNTTSPLNSIVDDAQQSADDAADSAAAALVSEGNAATSESNAGTSETNALASEDKAQEWAENPEDVPVETGPDQFSALHWSAKAEEFAQGAAANIAFDPSGVSITATDVQVMGEQLSDRTDVLVTGTLAVARGGTGVTSSTGTGSTVLSASPALTGNPTVPTQTTGNNSTRSASTAFVQSQIGASVGDTVTSSGTNSNGYFRLWSDGFIEQWLYVQNPSTPSITVTFAVAFSNTATVYIIGQQAHSSAVNEPTTLDFPSNSRPGSITATNFKVFNQGAGANFFFASGF